MQRCTVTLGLSGYCSCSFHQLHDDIEPASNQFIRSCLSKPRPCPFLLLIEEDPKPKPFPFASTEPFPRLSALGSWFGHGRRPRSPTGNVVELHRPLPVSRRNVLLVSPTHGPHVACPIRPKVVARCVLGVRSHRAAGHLPRPREKPVVDLMKPSKTIKNPWYNSGSASPCDAELRLRMEVTR